MKKWLPCLALFFLVFVTASCQKPEEVTLSKYFKAMNMKDNTTLAAMALEPVALEFKSWKAVSTEEPVIENYALPDMTKVMDDMKKARDEQLRKVQDEKYTLDTLTSEMNDARGRKKTELQQKVKTADEALKTETEKFNQMQAEISNKKAEIENEKTLVRLSTGHEQNLDAFEGKTITAKSHVQITTNSGDKEYVFILRKYELNNPKTNKPFHNKYVIMKFAPKEELDK